MRSLDRSAQPSPAHIDTDQSLLNTTPARDEIIDDLIRTEQALLSDLAAMDAITREVLLPQKLIPGSHLQSSINTLNTLHSDFARQISAWPRDGNISSDITNLLLKWVCRNLTINASELMNSSPKCARLLITTIYLLSRWDSMKLSASTIYQLLINHSYHTTSFDMTHPPSHHHTHRPSQLSTTSSNDR